MKCKFSNIPIRGNIIFYTGMGRVSLLLRARKFFDRVSCKNKKGPPVDCPLLVILLSVAFIAFVVVLLSLL